MEFARSLYPEGRSLLDIQSVKINNINGENPGDLYGTITIDDAFGSQSIYDRGREHHESITPGNYVSLTGPPRAFSADGEFTIDTKLWGKTSDASTDKEVSRGQIFWSFNNPGVPYDVPVSDTITGAYGSATVAYAVASNAAEARVEVILINGNGGNPADIYGIITAQNRFNEILLFQRGRHDKVPVRHQEAIDLMRSVIVVPMDSSLVIRVDLWGHGSDLSTDNSIASGTIKQSPEILRLTKTTIDGKHGRVEVRIDWF